MINPLAHPGAAEAHSAHLRFQDSPYHGFEASKAMNPTGHRDRGDKSDAGIPMMEPIHVRSVTGKAVVTGKEGGKVSEAVLLGTRKPAALVFDMEGIAHAGEEFFRRAVMAIAKAWRATDAGFVALANQTPEVQAAFDRALADLQHYFQAGAVAEGAVDQEIFWINLNMLLKGRELCRDNRILARILMGLEDEALMDYLEGVALEELRELALAGVVMFSPRISHEILQSILSQGAGNPALLLRFTSPQE